MDKNSWSLRIVFLILILAFFPFVVSSQTIQDQCGFNFPSNLTHICDYKFNQEITTNDFDCKSKSIEIINNEKNLLQNCKKFIKNIDNNSQCNIRMYLDVLEIPLELSNNSLCSDSDKFDLFIYFNDIDFDRGKNSQLKAASKWNQYMRVWRNLTFENVTIYSDEQMENFRSFTLESSKFANNIFLKSIHSPNIALPNSFIFQIAKFPTSELHIIDCKFKTISTKAIKLANVQYITLDNVKLSDAFNNDIIEDQITCVNNNQPIDWFQLNVHNSIDNLNLIENKNLFKLAYYCEPEFIFRANFTSNNLNGLIPKETFYSIVTFGYNSTDDYVLRKVKNNIAYDSIYCCENKNKWLYEVENNKSLNFDSQCIDIVDKYAQNFIGNPNDLTNYCTIVDDRATTSIILIAIGGLILLLILFALILFCCIFPSKQLNDIGLNIRDSGMHDATVNLPSVVSAHSVGADWQYAHSKPTIRGPIKDSMFKPPEITMVDSEHKQRKSSAPHKLDRNSNLSSQLKPPSQSSLPASSTSKHKFSLKQSPAAAVRRPIAKQIISPSVRSERSRSRHERGSDTSSLRSKLLPSLPNLVNKTPIALSSKANKNNGRNSKGSTGKIISETTNSKQQKVPTLPELSSISSGASKDSRSIQSNHSNQKRSSISNRKAR